jgi:predicted phosphatase
MAQQTAVEFLIDELKEYIKVDWPVNKTIRRKIEQAKQIEKEQRIKDYNVGYTDAQCNHINDAENYVNEIEYLRARIDDIDDEIKHREDKIADLLINGETYNK